jgi:glycosyltransferase involved in cell wall biosynthesis
MPNKSSRNRLRVYVDTPYLYIRPANTDWRYMHTLRTLEDFCALKMIYPFDVSDISKQSLAYLWNKTGFLKGWKERREKRSLSGRKLKRLGIDVVLNHGIPPTIEGADIPVVWYYGLIDHEMQRQFGVSEAQLSAQTLFFRRMLPRVSLVRVPTATECARHSRDFPEAASKFTNVSLFVPHVSSLSADEIRAKHSTRGCVEVLFVGKEGYRKGLDIMAAAIASLQPTVRERIHVTVVSKEIDQQRFKSFDAETYSFLPPSLIQQRMKRSHIFVMPSRFESFGIVFIEAMAAGCAVVAPNWEVQREITDYGRAGLNVCPECASVRTAMTNLVLDHEERCQIALNGNQRFNKNYSPEAVAADYMSMFETAVMRSE